VYEYTSRVVEELASLCLQVFPVAERSPFTVVQPSFTLVAWRSQPMPPSSERLAWEGADSLVAHVGALYAELAAEDVTLAEMGLDEYARLVDDLVEEPSAGLQ
jgi:hypothetical protein